MEQSIIEIDDHDIHVFYIDLDHVPLIIFKARRGYVMSGYLDMKNANDLGDIAGKIMSVTTIDAALNSKIIQASKKALKRKLKPGMGVREFLTRLG